MYSTANLRNSLGINGGVDQSSASYAGGKYAGYAWGAGTLIATGAGGSIGKGAGSAEDFFAGSKYTDKSRWWCRYPG